MTALTRDWNRPVAFLSVPRFKFLNAAVMATFRSYLVLLMCELVGHSFNSAPHKIVHRVEIVAARTLRLHHELDLTLKEFHGLLRRVAPGAILLPDPMASFGNPADPGEHVGVHGFDVNIDINLQAHLQEVWRHDFTLS